MYVCNSPFFLIGLVFKHYLSEETGCDMESRDLSGAKKRSYINDCAYISRSLAILAMCKLYLISSPYLKIRKSALSGTNYNLHNSY